MAAEARTRELESYQTKNGRIPFREWLASLDIGTQAAISAQIEKLRQGNFGNCKRLRQGGGVFELRINLGPGYRVYFGEKGGNLIVLLAGGDKGSQERDIKLAKRYWEDCLREN